MRLRVLTFNTWGVPLFSRARAARMRAIGGALAALDVDVVALQEVFSAKDRRIIMQGAAAAGLLHSHYFASGVMGSGLFTLSRYPIAETSFLRFRLNGRPQDLIRSDYYAGKGIGRVRVQTPAGPVDVYNAHFIAPYLEFGPDRFAAHRVAQALEASRYMRAQSGPVPSVLGCDLNCFPDDLTYRTLTSAGDLVETYGAANPQGAMLASANQSGYATMHPPHRFDYVFARGALTVTGSNIVLGGTPVPNPDGIRGYSDHYGIRSEFELAPARGDIRESAAADISLTDIIGHLFGRGIHSNRTHRRKAKFAAAAAGMASAAFLRTGVVHRPGLGGRALAMIALAALLVTGGVNLSTAARLNSETNTLNTLLGEEL